MRCLVFKYLHMVDIVQAADGFIFFNPNINYTADVLTSISGMVSDDWVKKHMTLQSPSSLLALNNGSSIFPWECQV